MRGDAGLPEGELGVVGGTVRREDFGEHVGQLRGKRSAAVGCAQPVIITEPNR